MTEHQDVWVCPCCLKTFAVSNAKTFMTADKDGTLECPECHGANFIEFERWTPRLKHDGEDWCDPCVQEEDHRWVPWACHSGLSGLFGWEFESEVLDGGWLEGLYIVGSVRPGGSRFSCKQVPDVYTYTAFGDWMRPFGTRFPWIRLEKEHYTQ